MRVRRVAEPHRFSTCLSIASGRRYGLAQPGLFDGNRFFLDQADIAALPADDSLCGAARRLGAGEIPEFAARRLDRRSARAGPLPRRGGFFFGPGPRARFQTAAGRLERAAATLCVSIMGERLRREHVKSPPAARHRVLCPASPHGLLNPMTRMTRNPVPVCTHVVRKAGGLWDKSSYSLPSRKLGPLRTRAID
jgi:hypothetical protein